MQHLVMRAIAEGESVFTFEYETADEAARPRG